MLDQRRRLLAAFTIATSALAILGCPKSVQRQLESAAKDWSAMVRRARSFRSTRSPRTSSLATSSSSSSPDRSQQEIYRPSGIPAARQSSGADQPRRLRELLRAIVRAGEQGRPQGLAGHGRGPQEGVVRRARRGVSDLLVRRQEGQGAEPCDPAPGGSGRSEPDATSEAVGASASATRGRSASTSFAPRPAGRHPAAGQSTAVGEARSDPGGRGEPGSPAQLPAVITRVYLTGEVDISLDMTALAAGGRGGARSRPSCSCRPATKTGRRRSRSTITRRTWRR